MTTHDHTIDWDDYWRNDRESETEFPANVGRNGKADLAERFFEAVGVPDDFAAVGCGPADCPLTLADRYPDTDFHCYDAAESVVADNRERDHSENVTFGVDVLPALDTDRRFDCVYCYATLHYVESVERAVAELYDRVRPGGHLVLNYPSEESHEFFHDEFADEPGMRERFRLVFEGRNLLSADAIADLLDAPVHDYWEVVDAGPEDGAGPHNPCVYVPRE